MSGTSIYNAWSAMVRRCTKPKDAAFKNYGGRGITVCARWLDSFEAFYADMGEKPSKKHSLERIDNSKGYSPDNCKWATQAEQCRNRRGNRWVEFRGQRMILAEFARHIGIRVTSVQKHFQVHGEAKALANYEARYPGNRG